jgi:DNA polymerase-3 subunit alpha
MPEPKDFAHLHVHTEFSTLDGINRVDTLPDHISSMGQQACAITDHGTVAGTYTFFKSALAKSIKPILGMEAYYTVGDKTAKEKDADGQNYYHLVLLAKNNQGLQNLFKISTIAYTEGMYYKPRADDALLAECSAGLMATSACLGSRASKLILAGRFNEAEALILHHTRLFNDFFIEVQLHEGKEQQLVNKALIDIAWRHNLPLVLTNDCHYTHEHDKQLHEQTLCMSTNAKMSDAPWDPEHKGTEAKGPTRFSFGDIDVHVARTEWMTERAQRLGIPLEAITNTSYVAAMVDSDSYFSDRRNRYPRFQDLPANLPPWEALENLSKNMLAEKMGGIPPQEYRDRLNFELGIIKRMGFYDYLLIVEDFIRGARDADIWTGPGRGSAAGSLVAYALGITKVDPIKYGLVFERWLNYGRSATPLLLDKQMIKQIEAAPTGQPHVCSANCTHDHDHH